MRKFLRRAYAVLHRRRLRRELEEEMAAHREMMPAGRRRNFGSTLRLQEEAGDQWGWTWLDHFFQDFSYGARSLRRSPGFAATAIAVLSLGIGVNLAEVHVFKALFERLHVRDADSLVRFLPLTRSKNEADVNLQAIEFYRKFNSVLSGVLSESDMPGVFAAQDSEDLRCGMVSGNYFDVLGITPAYGRVFHDEDNKPGAPPVAVLSWDFWQNRFAGDPGIVMKFMRLNDKPVQVVGIAPPDFSGLLRNGTPVWMPFTQYPYLMGNSKWQVERSGMIGVLKPGISIDAAGAQFQSLVAELRRQQPQLVEDGERIEIDRFESTRALKGQVLVLMVACVSLVLLVLLSACANLGNMLLARGLSRQREIEIRLAIGAGRWRLIRQLMTENLLLAMLASLIALAVGKAAARLLLRMIEAPSNVQIVTDWPVVAACAAFGLIAVLAFGLAPAVQIVRGGARAGRARKFLVSFQVAVSCVLLILSSFLIGGVRRNFASVLAFDPASIALVDPVYYFQRYTPAQARRAALDLTAAIRRIPGVDSAAITTIPPFRRSWMDHVANQQLSLAAVDPAYFPTMRLPVVQGRPFEPFEPDVALVSETAARKLWPGESPVGKSCLIAKRTRTIVGVVKDSGANLVGHPESVEAYVPLDDSTIVYATILLHASHPGAVIPSLRAVATVTRYVPLVGTLQSFLSQNQDSVRKILMIVSSLGAVASLLAMLGIFGLLAFTVAQRTREIGVRLALGARAKDVLGCVLGQYAVPFAAGGAGGVALAAAFATAMRSLIFGFVPLQLLSYGAGLAFFALISAIAAIAPARRALRIDPASALRHD